MNSGRMQAETSEQIAKNGVLWITEGKVRDHKLGNSAREHTGAVEDKERHMYRDFLPNKNCCMILELTGSDYYE